MDACNEIILGIALLPSANTSGGGIERLLPVSSIGLHDVREQAYS